MGKNEARNVRVFEPGKFVSVPSNGKDIKLIVTVSDTTDNPMAGSYEIWGLVGGAYGRLKAVDIRTLGTVNVIESPGVYQIVAAGAFEGIGFGETDNSNETGDVSFVGRFIEGDDDSLSVAAKFAENHHVRVLGNASWPWGTNIEYEHLVKDIVSNNAHADITIIGNGYQNTFKIGASSDGTHLYASGASLYATLSDCLCAMITWNSGGSVSTMYILSEGAVTNVDEMANTFETTLDIYYHPMTN